MDEITIGVTTKDIVLRLVQGEAVTTASFKPKYARHLAGQLIQNAVFLEDLAKEKDNVNEEG